MASTGITPADWTLSGPMVAAVGPAMIDSSPGDEVISYCRQDFPGGAPSRCT
ncbi:MAG TPA: hypothetical protein VFP55_06020 [Solirubrobacteraceae bacterium]|nr:hypothetical protein [Solirubrobacteraceae bacterium]